jgi:hypothetical protein
MRRVFIVCLLLCSGSWAQTDPLRSSQSAVESQSIAYLQTLSPQERQASPAGAQIQGNFAPPAPFDFAVTTLGPNYSGVNTQVIADSLKTSGIASPKGEYETSSAYADRQRGTTLPFQSIAFLLNGKGRMGYGGSVSTSYDADKQILDVLFVLSKRKIGAREIFGIYDLDGTILQSDHYLGTNAFGATADVTSLRTKSYSLAIDDGTWLTHRTIGYALEPAKIDLPIKMPPEKAKDLSGYLGILLVGSLQSPWVSQGLSFTSATLANPVDSANIRTYLHFAPISIWLFDKRTGDVLFKFSERSLVDQLNQLELERRSVYPLRLDIDGSSNPPRTYFTYIVDDGEEVRGKYVNVYYGTIPKLPMTIEAKHRIRVKIYTKPNFEYYRIDLVFKLNGAPVKPKWHISKNPFLAEAVFEAPN